MRAIPFAWNCYSAIEARPRVPLWRLPLSACRHLRHKTKAADASAPNWRSKLMARRARSRCYAIENRDAAVARPGRLLSPLRKRILYRDSNRRLSEVRQVALPRLALSAPPFLRSHTARNLTLRDLLRAYRGTKNGGTRRCTPNIRDAMRARSGYD